MGNKRLVKIFNHEVFIFIGIFSLIFGLISFKMGFINMLNTIMNTSYQLLLDTVFLIMSVAVISGAIASLLNEFGVVALINRCLSGLIEPIYGLPGASIVGIMATYLSDNPAILTLAKEEGFKRYFKPYQLPALTNIGTSYGMGLIITTFMIGLSNDKNNFVIPALIGNLGAIIGSIISVRLMLYFSKKVIDVTEKSKIENDAKLLLNYRYIREGNIGTRVLSSLLEGGKSGVEMGLAIIPGVLIICTFVLLLTNGAGANGYSGQAYEGVAFLPYLAAKMDFIIKPLFGFTSNLGIAIPITALGAAGAAIGLIPNLVQQGLAGGNDIAVFTAMCMCFSGYLSTHVALMDSLGFEKLCGKAIISHTIGGIAAGIAAHWLYILFMLF